MLANNLALLSAAILHSIFIFITLPDSASFFMCLSIFIVMLAGYGSQSNVDGGITEENED